MPNKRPFRFPKDGSYVTYIGMKARCYQPSHKDFHNYGGRGIQVCDRWRFGVPGQYGFDCFMDDMGARPEGCTLDRIDQNGNYTPENCRWATTKEQSFNRRNNRREMVGGRNVLLAEAAMSHGLSPRIVAARIDRYGMSIEDALTRPLRPRGNAISGKKSARRAALTGEDR
ncbi:hypothetical protein GCM10007276_11960 [Agaricicola taiwanensis]|uniref:Uncharacterized protein n=1 Tax=Agaricicola taiwanensis TaxID=591372 RepID=A0A8J2VNQ7_9RHOB|nr:hypothetical protein [Agaricicola taiwanensis]GGE36091.1 hypothetical protein GCM10007276_11960 [Agaricicola taiwanensis]